MMLFLPTCYDPDARTYEHPYCCRRLCHEPEVESKPSSYYVSCFECRHYYRTRWHLAAAYLRRIVEDRMWWAIHWQTLRRVLRPSRIFFCQCCSHDF